MTFGKKPVPRPAPHQRPPPVDVQAEVDRPRGTPVALGLRPVGLRWAVVWMEIEDGKIVSERVGEACLFGFAALKLQSAVEDLILRLRQDRG